MVQLFKGIFSNNGDNTETEIKDDLPSYQQFVLVDRYAEGRQKAEAHDGSETALLTCVRCIYENHKEILRRDEIEQENAKQPYRIKLKECENKTEYFQSKIKKIKEEDIPKVKSKIEQLQEDIREIKRNPEDYVGDKVGKAGFVIGGIILTLLTVYLFVFYSSASYSAFFKVYPKTYSDNIIASSIFDAQALSKALNGGLAELILILTIPSVFLGLGYLIHKFGEEKKQRKVPMIPMLIVVTLIFDVILAYDITKKIYDVEARDSFKEMDPYTFNTVNFWLIIFAGFIVYLIWGFVFSFVMEAYGKLDKISVHIKAKQEEIQNKEQEERKFEEEINQLNGSVSNNETEIEKLKTILSGMDIIKPRELEHSIVKFLDGWLEYLSFKHFAEDARRNAHNLVFEFINVNIKSIEL
jgi:uncharacterized membrane protein (DUF106 family)